MAANKKANAIKEAITLTASIPDYAGYADYFLQTETKFRLQNSYSENLTVTLKVWDDKNLAVPYETTVEVPYESAAEVSVNGLVFSADACRKQRTFRIDGAFFCGNR